MLKLMRTTIAATVLAVTFASACAKADTKQQKLEELAEMLGFKLLFQHHDALTYPPGKPIIDHPDSAPPPFGNFSYAALMKTWTEGYSQTVTEEELDTILAYYRSPIGQKDLAAQQRGLAGYNALLAASADELVKKIKEALGRAP